MTPKVAIQKPVGSDSTYFLHDTQGRVIAQYASTDPNTPPEKWFIHGDGFEALAMLQEPDEPNDWTHFIGFMETWLAVDGNDLNYDSDYDFDSSGVVDMNDYAVLASNWDYTIDYPSAYYYLHDALGSTMGLLTNYPDANDWREFYLYDAWGNIQEGSDVGNPYLWAGYYHDAETDDYFCLNRYYKPSLARWTQNDPLGTEPDGFLKNEFSAKSQYGDGLGLYEYALGCPVNNLDVYGLRCTCGGDVTDLLVSHFNQFITQPEGDLSWNPYIGIAGLAGEARSNSNLIKKASKTGRCPQGDDCRGTVTICSSCFSGYHIDHFLWMVYSSISYGELLTREAGKKNERDNPSDWNEPDLEANEVGLCIARAMHPAWTQIIPGSGYGPPIIIQHPAKLLTREAICKCFSDANIDVIQNKPASGGTNYKNCKPCKDKVKCSGLELPAYDL
jgi:RHS repeat-associated protein